MVSTITIFIELKRRNPQVIKTFFVTTWEKKGKKQGFIIRGQKKRLKTCGKLGKTFFILNSKNMHKHPTTTSNPLNSTPHSHRAFG